MKDVKELHQIICPRFNSNLDLSLDGVQECRSSSLSIDIFSVSFKCCRNVYPIRIIRPLNKFKVNDQDNIKLVLDDIFNNGCHLKNVVGDTPKRSNLRCGLCSGAAYACEYCESKAEYVKENGKRKGHLAWPYSSTGNGKARTVENILSIVEKIQNGDDMNRDDCKGFYGESHLLELENFDFVVNIPVEYMHSGCIGVVKRLILLTFNVGENRDRTTNRKLSEVSDYNKLISYIQVVRVFNRRFRNLDLGVMKAQEYRNVIMYFFPIVINCIQDGFNKEKQIWLYLTYIFRACTLPNKEFENIPNSVIEHAAKKFYKNFEIIYGKKKL